VAERRCAGESSGLHELQHGRREVQDVYVQEPSGVRAAGAIGAATAVQHGLPVLHEVQSAALCTGVGVHGDQ
jgi:hypothetical protein